MLDFRVRNARFAIFQAVLLLAATIVPAGCTPGIQWRDYAYDAARDASRRGNKLAFIYFRQWSSVECTQFEEKVLKDPRILQATTDLYCVALEFGWDEGLARDWGITAPPAVALVDPQGRVLAKSEGLVSAEELLKRVQAAQLLFEKPPRGDSP